MNIFFSNQTKNLQKHLDFLKGLHVITDQKKDLKEKTSSIIINTTKSLYQLNLNIFWNYQIFPHKIMDSMTEWSQEGRAMKIGDTILQQIYLPPIKSGALQLLLGVRINNIIKEEHRIGYCYETLKGHVETGESTFILEKTDDNKIIFSIRTFSKPGNSLLKFFGSLLTLPYQTFCTQRALKNVKYLLEI